MTMEAIHSNARASFAYYGPNEGWLVALSVHRDSDALERSNWDAITEDMIARFDTDVAIERMNHWAVGWLDYLLVKPDTEAVRAAEEWIAKLADYPVADEDAYSMLEYEEEWCVRCDSGTREQHDDGLCRKFRSEEDAYEIVWRWRHRRDR